MQPLLIILIAIIIYVYVSYYYRYPTSVKILSAYDKNFNSSLMMDKQPIVILDTDKTLQQFKKETVPYLPHITRIHDPLIWSTNACKYILIKSEIEGEIHLLPPSKKLIDNIPSPDETLITLEIKPSQIIILPFKWHYYSEKKLDLLGIHDYITWFLL